MSEESKDRRFRPSLLGGPLAARARPLLPAFLIVAAGIAVYSNTFFVPFHFDDLPKIRHNPAIRTWWPPWLALEQGRPVAQYTFALNYAVHGYDVWGYHVVNLAIHLTSGLLLYGIVRRTLSRTPLEARWGPVSDPLALVIALIWTVHPLQTQAVTYIVQRHESLMGMFFLATFYAFLRAQEAAWPWLWYGAAMGFCVLGLRTKEVMAAAPPLLLWHDRVFVGGTWREIARRRKWFHLGLLAMDIVLLLAPLAIAIIAHRDSSEDSTVIFVEGLTPWTYLVSQSGVIVHYLRLCFWPQGQCLDYVWPVAKGIGEVLPQSLLILALLGATVWCMFRHPPWGFLGGWFFLILAPTSSIVPIADLAFEHRMYLPLAAVVAATTLGVFTALVRPRASNRTTTVTALTFALFVAAALGTVAFHRNYVYSDARTLWSDVVAKRPNNPRGLYNLGVTEYESKRYEAAMRLFLRAIELLPTYAAAYNDAGLAMEKLGKTDLAMAYYRRALELDPKHAEAHVNLGKLLRSSDPAKAIDHFRLALQFKPHYSEAHNNLGAMLVRSDPQVAEKHYQLALEYDSLNPDAHNNYANLLARRGEREAAIKHYRRALELRPDFELAQKNLRIVERMHQGKNAASQ